LYSGKDRLANLDEQKAHEFADCDDSKVAVELLENAGLAASNFKTISHENQATL